MRFTPVLVVLTLATPQPSPGQTPVCQQPLASLTVPSLGYAEVSAPPFQERVFVYVPEIQAGGGRFKPFQMWIVEGVYGSPFVQTKGSLDAAGFDKLRNSRNVRATPVSVARGDGSDRGQFRIGRARYSVEVVRVNLSKGSGVDVRVCR